MILLAFLKQDILEIIIQPRQRFGAHTQGSLASSGLREPAAINHRTPNAARQVAESAAAKAAAAGDAYLKICKS